MNVVRVIAASGKRRVYRYNTLVLTTHVPDEVAVLARKRARQLGMSMSQYLGGLVRTDLIDNNVTIKLRYS